MFGHSRPLWTMTLIKCFHYFELVSYHNLWTICRHEAPKPRRVKGGKRLLHQVNIQCCCCCWILFTFMSFLEPVWWFNWSVSILGSSRFHVWDDIFLFPWPISHLLSSYNKLWTIYAYTPTPKTKVPCFKKKKKKQRSVFFCFFFFCVAGTFVLLSMYGTKRKV